MSLLSWRPAEPRDRTSLQVFTCTVPPLPYRPPRPRHPKQWELDVQQFIRGLRPPVGPDEMLLIGEDASGIAAVSLSWVPPQDPSVVKLLAIAVAARFRGKGGEYADEALQTTLDVIEERVSQYDLESFLAFGLIDRRNQASKRMCERAGLVHVGDNPNGLEEWAILIDLQPTNETESDPQASENAGS
jgi:hypothetical protein